MAENRPGSQRQVAELVLQLSRAAYADVSVGDLTQAQWMALRFFARANRFSRTVSAFADFHGTTRGTASQTVKSLVDQGYLTRKRSDRDGRSTCFDLTAQSRRKLAEDPLEDMVRAVGALTPTQQARTAAGLKQVLLTLADERGRSVVGVCAVCGHLGTSADGSYRCRLLQEDLISEELEELCVRFLPSARGRTVAGLAEKD